MHKRHRDQGQSEEHQFTKKFAKNSKDSQTTVEERQDHPGDLKKFIKDDKVIKILNNSGIKGLFPIQYKTFQIIFDGNDIKAKDKTGSGKTLAFSLPIIQKFRQQQLFKGSKNTKFLVILPTRQLVLQVVSNISNLRLTEDQFSVVGVYGGEKPYIQIQKLKKGADIIVATPGRLIDMIDRGKINFSLLKATCLDEADQMLKMGFQKDIQTVYAFIKKSCESKTQNLLFSATFPDWVSDISKNYQTKDCIFIDLVGKTNIQSPASIQHLAIRMNYEGQQKDLISSLIEKYSPNNGKTIIFCQTKLKVNSLYDSFKRNDVQRLHGDVPQDKRQQIYHKFKSGKVNIVVATNVAARGLDFPEIMLVVQTEPPKEVQSYIHRAGRTGRAGRKGTAVILYTAKDSFKVKQIQKICKIQFKDVNIKQLE